MEQLAQVLDRAGLSDVAVRVYGKHLQGSSHENLKPATPGMKYRHYSPEARVILVQLCDNDACASMKDVLQELLSSLSRDHTPHVGLMCALDSPLVQLLQLPLLERWTKQATNHD